MQPTCCCYRKMADQIQQLFPKIQPLNKDACCISEKQVRADLASIYFSSEQSKTVRRMEAPEYKDITIVPYRNYPDISWWTKQIKPPAKLATNPHQDKTVLFIHDSYAGYGPLPLLRSHFGKTYSFWMYIETHDLIELAQMIKPDLVVELRVERSLRFIPGQERIAE